MLVTVEDVVTMRLYRVARKTIAEKLPLMLESNDLRISAGNSPAIQFSFHPRPQYFISLP